MTRINLLRMHPKACTKCGLPKPPKMFRVQRSRGGFSYRHGSCNACQAKEAAALVKANRTHVNGLNLRRYDSVKKLDNEFVEKKRKSAREASARSRLKPEVRQRCRDYAREARSKDTIKFLLKGALCRAKARGLEFDLTEEWARERWTGKCELTGIGFVPSIGRQSALSPSIDRRDSSNGYTQKNCRFILSAVNSFKGASSDDTMIRIAAALLEKYRG